MLFVELFYPKLSCSAIYNLGNSVAATGAATVHRQLAASEDGRTAGESFPVLFGSCWRTVIWGAARAGDIKYTHTVAVLKSPNRCFPIEGLYKNLGKVPKGLPVLVGGMQVKPVPDEPIEKERLRFPKMEDPGMNDVSFSLKARRATRLPLRIPILLVFRENETEKERTLDAWTLIVNVNGARVECKHLFETSQEVVIRVPHLGKSQKGVIVWRDSSANKSGSYECGIKLEKAENLWGVGFPP